MHLISPRLTLDPALEATTTSLSRDTITDPLNRTIDAISIILPVVVSSAAEAALAGTFIKAQYAVATHYTLEDSGTRRALHPF